MVLPFTNRVKTTTRAILPERCAEIQQKGPSLLNRSAAKAGCRAFSLALRVVLAEGGLLVDQRYLGRFGKVSPTGTVFARPGIRMIRSKPGNCGLARQPETFRDGFA